MALEAGNPVVGGTVLRRVAVESPNFVTGSSGWVIRQDGSAEFNNLVIRNGTIISGIDLIYSGVPAAGNLIASIAASAGTDSFGNAYLAGETTYSLAGGGTAISLQGSVILFFTGPATGAGPWVLQSTISGGAGASGGMVVSTSSLFINTTSFKVGLGPTFIREWYPPSGTDDFAALNTALSTGHSVDLIPGTYQLSAMLPVSGAMLAGCDMTTVIKPFSGYAGTLLQAGAKGSIRNLTVSNSAANAIQVQSGIAEWWLEDLVFSSNVGLCISVPVTGPTHGRIRGIRGLGGSTANGGGIDINGGSAGAVTAEINISDLDIQNCQTSEILRCSAVTDIRCNGPFNGAIASGVNASGITIQGACQTIDLGSIDIGGGSGPGLLVIKDNRGFSPSEIQVGPGVLQSAAAGVVVSGGAARLSFDRLWCKRMQGDGWFLTNTGAFNTMTKCGGNLNNQAAGIAYDVEVDGTGHWLNDGFSYVSGGVTAGRNLIAGNKYTEVNAPSSLTTAGAAPGGW